ncbi:MAG: TRAP transporter fused permease subunit [Angelakisella sp.]|nr:TRAP transporter fused permease subunit [Angelakisella sp.]
MSQDVLTPQNRSGMEKFFQPVSVLVAVVLCVFHLLVASPLLTMNNTEKAAIHGALIVIYFLLVSPIKWKSKTISSISRVVDVALIVITALAAYEVILMRNSNSASATLYNPYQQAISIIFLVVALIVGVRAVGRILPVVCVVFLLYTLFGRYLPGMWATARVSLTRMATYLMVGSEGLFGTALSTAANYIFLFVLFGSILNFIGAGEFFVKIAFAAFGKIRGGPAQAAIYSSMLMGMVNGSGAANVVTTGTFTIPLMKKCGFDKDTAGAIEAVASNGGQIMPPVMGAVAFLMSDATSLPYTTICFAALIPACLYYLTVSTAVASYAHQKKIPIYEGEAGESVWKIFLSGWFYFLPIVILVGMMVLGYSAQRAALVTILVCALIGLIIDRKRFTVSNLVELAKQSAGSMMTVSIACMIAGIIVGAVNITGFGLKLSGIITALSGGHIFVMGVLAALVCIILGMGLPTSACYIVLAVLVAPAMVDLGVSVISAHMFILYYGVVAAITPPVALAVFAAIGISGGDMWKTGLQSMKLAATALIIPFIFLYNNDLLLFTPATNTFGFTPIMIVSLLTALIGCMFMALSFFGWCFRDLNRVERLLLLPCSIFLMMNEPLWLNGVGLALGLVILIGAKLTSTNKMKGDVNTR